MLTADEIREIETEAAHYPKRDAVCIDAMRIVQRHQAGSRTRAFTILRPSRHVRHSVDSVATFYNLLFRKPVGRHVVMVCDSVSCWIMGYDECGLICGERLGIEHGQTTPTIGLRCCPSCARLLRPCSGHDGGRRSA